MQKCFYVFVFFYPLHNNFYPFHNILFDFDESQLGMEKIGIFCFNLFGGKKNVVADMVLSPPPPPSSAEMSAKKVFFVVDA